MDGARLRRLFSACDVNKSGRIEFEDFTVICREHSVPQSEIRPLFDRLDADEDGSIDYEEFSSMFHEFSGALDHLSFAAAVSSTVLGGSWEEFADKSNVESVFSESLREQLADLYQALHSSPNTTLLQQFEEVVQSLAGQSLDSQMELQQLGTNLKRAEDMNSSRLAEVEEDTQLQLAKAEDRVRDEERKKMEAILSDMKKQHSKEMEELHDAVDGLKKGESQVDPSKEVNHLMTEILSLTRENQQLQTTLLQAQTNISVLQTELDKIKNTYMDQKTHHERVNEDLKKMISEYQSYSSQIRLLQEMNKQLCDSNDSLRSALESEVVATKRRMSPQTEIKARKTKPLRQSSRTSVFSHVALWADKADGVPQQTDPAESSSSDYDSDGGRNSLETVYQSCSYVQSDSDEEISEVTSEAAVSLAPSVASSFSSSMKRRLSAFSTKQSDADVTELEGATPMFRLVLAGDAGSGKSSFLLRLMRNEFRGDIQSTLGVDFQIKRLLVDGERTSLQIWDTAGQERFRSIARSYFRKAHGVLMLYDVTSESSFLNVRAWADEIQNSTEEKLPMCVIGNKVDLKESGPDGSCVSSLLGEKLAKEYGALFCETSAKEGTNVVEAVLHLAREVKKSVKLRQRSDSRVQLGEMSKKGNCCQL